MSLFRKVYKFRQKTAYQMKHRRSSLILREKSPFFIMSDDDDQIQDITSDQYLQLGIDAFPNFTHLFQLLSQEDDDLKDEIAELLPEETPSVSSLPDDSIFDQFLMSSDDSDFNPTSPGPSSPCNDEGACEAKERSKGKMKPRRRNRRKPLESKTLLAQCLLQWLDDPEHNPAAITWISKEQGLFQITDSSRISALWGSKKDNKKEMNHEKLSRALRHYYKDGTLERLSNKRRLCYKFSDAAMRKFSAHFANDS